MRRVDEAADAAGDGDGENQPAVVEELRICDAALRSSTA